MNNVVLSIFPGIDVVGKGFEELGCCVVRGPDVLWGGDVRAFHPPAGVFWGVIGGPPCQAFSALRHLLAAQGHTPRWGNLIPEFERCIAEAQPDWFVMENVMDAPIPVVEGYIVRPVVVRDKWVGGVTPRPRRFSFGTRDGRDLDIEWCALMPSESVETVMAGHGPVGRGEHRSALSSGIGTHGGGRAEGFEGGRLPGAQTQSIADACEAQGLPRDFTDHMPFTMHGKRQVVGNAWTLPMSRAIAKAVLKAMGPIPSGEEGR